MLGEVLRLLQRDGSLLPGEVARRLHIPLEEAEAAIEMLAALGRVSRYRLGGACSGQCGPCAAHDCCPLVAGIENSADAAPGAAAGPSPAPLV